MAPPLVLPSIRSLFPALQTTPSSRPYWDPVRLDAALLPPAELSTISDIESESEQKPDLDADIDMPEQQEQKQEQEPEEKSPTPPRRRGRDVRGPRARKFPCDICPSVFERPSSLDQHKRSHTGEKPFSCEICGKRFSVSSNARRHDRTCHAEVVAERERLRLNAVAALRAGPTPPSLADSSSSPSMSIIPSFSHRSGSSHHYQARRLHFDPSQPSLVDKKSGPKHAKDQLSDPSLRVLMTTKASYPNEMEVDMPMVGNPYRVQQRPQIPQVSLSPRQFMLTELAEGLEDVKRSASKGGRNNRAMREQPLRSSGLLLSSYSIQTSTPPSASSWSSSPSRSLSPFSASSSSEEPTSPISSCPSSSTSSPAMRSVPINWSHSPYSRMSPTQNSPGGSGR